MQDLKGNLISGMMFQGLLSVCDHNFGGREKRKVDNE